jgi:hypothetical protein
VPSKVRRDTTKYPNYGLLVITQGNSFMILQSSLKHNHLVGKHAFSIKTKFKIEVIKNLALTLKKLLKRFRVKKFTLSSLGYSTSWVEFHN